MHCTRFDACYDSKGVWTEKQCSDPQCSYCTKRPATLTRRFCESCPAFATCSDVVVANGDLFLLRRQDATR